MKIAHLVARVCTVSCVIGCLLFFEIFLTYNCKDACKDSINFSLMNRISQWQIWLVLLHTNKCIEDHTMWLLRINVNPIYGHWLEGDYLYILRQPLAHPKAPEKWQKNCKILSFRLGCYNPLCSRNFQNVKLRLDFVEIW